MLCGDMYPLGGGCISSTAASKASEVYGKWFVLNSFTNMKNDRGLL